MSTTTTSPQKKFRSYVPDNTTMPEFTLRAVPVGPGTHRYSRRCQRLSGSARRHDHRRHLSCGCYRHGGVAPHEGLAAGREHCPNRRLDRRIRGSGRHLHHSGIRDLGRVAGVRLSARLLEIVHPDAGGRCARHSLRHPAASRDGRRSGASFPGVGSRLANSHCRTTGQPGRQDPVRQHGFRRSDLPARPVQPVQRQPRFHRQGWLARYQLCPHGPQRDRAQVAGGRSDHDVRARHQPGLSWGRLHHRTASGFAEFRRRRDRLGPAGSPDPVPRRPDSGRSVCPGGHHAARHRVLDGTGWSGVELHRAPHRRRRHAGGRLLHPVPHAQEPGLGHGARGF